MPRGRSGLSTVAPAKVNLTLAVVGRRDDGYHALESVFARIGLYDELTVERLAPWESPDLDRDELTVDGPCAYQPTRDDLVLRAAAALRRQGSPGLPRLRFTLTKRIPAAAGLGGGSSDAAAALLLAALAWDLEVDQTGLLALAERVGSDVPFFASALRVALVRGRGESLASLGSPAAPLGLVTVTPADRLSTEDVFAALAMRRERPVSDARAVTARLADLIATGADPAAIVALAPLLRDANDLWPAALRVLPGLAGLRFDLEQTLARPFLMSGSGPTLFAIYASIAEAAAAVAILRGSPMASLEGAVIHGAELPAAR
ncbi:MAG: 4-(cytidine 5'-diphospho)-2-C-methyl-D-erythritol kinase [Chloroflexi bacterium]|nr:4-(cytidine 5'-diphospho)-2-C-methyl-D-erythritol kinase [Chloroflexota bacterium]